MKKLIFIILLFTICLHLSAQEKYLKNASKTLELSEKAVDLFMKNEISDCFKELTPYWPLPQNELEALEEKTIKYLNLIEDRFGNAIGSVKVNHETISDMAIRETYLVKYEFTAIRCIFTYYKNDKGWLINAFKWDDSFSEEFKESPATLTK